MEHAKHIIRAVLLLAIIVIVLIVARHFASPDSFGRHGAYRFDSVAEHGAKMPVHGPARACDECHDEQAKPKSEGSHKSISCEVCHAPLAGHVKDDEWKAPMPVNRSKSLCAWCHEQLVARPKDFPQVVIADHVAEKEAQMSPNVCLECHDAHNPSE